MDKNYLLFSSNLETGQICLFKVTSDTIEDIDFENESFQKQNLIGIAYSMDLNSVYINERLVVNEITSFYLKQAPRGLTFLAECQEKLSKNGNYYKHLVPLKDQDKALISEKQKLLENQNACISHHGCERIDQTKSLDDIYHEEACCGGASVQPEEGYGNEDGRWYFYPYRKNVLNFDIKILEIEILESGKIKYYLDYRSSELIYSYYTKSFANCDSSPDGLFINDPKWCNHCYLFLDYLSSGNKVVLTVTADTIHPNIANFLSEKVFENAWIGVSYLDLKNKIYENYDCCSNNSEVINAVESIKSKLSDLFIDKRLSITRYQFFLLEK